MKWIIKILGYTYWPLVYFIVYLPFIVPRLEQWKHIPFWIFWTAIIGFFVILITLGAKGSHKSIIIHSFCIALFLQIFVYLVSILNMPALLKAYETGFFPDAIMIFVIIGAGITLVCEFGYFVKILKRKLFDTPQ